MIDESKGRMKERLEEAQKSLAIIMEDFGKLQAFAESARSLGIPMDEIEEALRAVKPVIDLSGKMLHGRR